MKRAQVFKKTLLSVAVVTALGGNVSLSYSADALKSMKINESIFQEGVKPGFWLDVDETVVTFGKADASKVIAANDMRSLLVKKETAFKKQIETFKANKKIAEKEEAVKKAREAHKAAVSGSDTVAKKELLDKAEAALAGVKKEVADKEKAMIDTLVNELNKRAGVSLFEMVAVEQPGPNGNNEKATPPPELQYRVKPQEKVIAPKPVPVASTGLDGKPLGVDVALVKGEKEEKDFVSRVSAVASKIQDLKDDDVKALFAKKGLVKVEDGDAEEWVPADSAKISNVNLVNDRIRGDLFGKIQKATDLGGDKGSVVELSKDDGLVFKNEQLELNSVNNSALVDGQESESVITDVYSSANTKKDPAGSYVLTGEGSIYHKDIGKERALKELKVEGQQVKVLDAVESPHVIQAQHVVVGKGGSIAGYSIEGAADENGQPSKKVEKVGYVRVIAPDMPEGAVVKNDKGEVIGRQNSTVNIDSDETQRGDLIGYEVINFSGKELLSREISGDEVNFTKGEVVFESGGEEELSAGVLNVGKEAVVRATEEIVDPKDESGKKVIREKPVKVTGRNVTRQKQVSNDDGKTWVDVAGEVDVVGRDYVIDGEMIGDFEDVDSLVVNGALVSDKVGSEEKRLKKLTLGKSGTLTRFSKGGNTVYTDKEAEYDITADQKLINDVDGFKSFHLNGGVFEGSLTPSAAAEDAETNKDAFQGATVTLTSGIYQGGTIKSDKTIVIDGNVVFKPGVTPLKSFDADGNPETTVLNPVVLDGRDVLLTSKARPEIHKTYKIKGEDGKEKLATPARWGKNVTMDKGAELPVSLDMSESAEDSAVAYVRVDQTLTVNGNVVRATVESGKDYEVTRELYHEALAAKGEGKGSVKGKDFAVIDAGEIKGDFGDPVSSSKLLKASSVATELEGGRTGYGVNLSFNEESVGEIRKDNGLNDQQTFAVGALEVAALTADDKKAGSAIHDSFANAVNTNTVKQLANESVHNEVLNGGLAQSALTVHRKVNENISRRLDRSRTGVSSGDMFESQGFWGQYFYSDGSMDSKNGTPGFESKINGITIGVDADLNPDFTAGVAFSYAKSKLNNKSVSGEAKADTYVGSVYGGWNHGSYFLDGMLSYAGSRHDIERVKNKADSVKGSMWGARAVAGYMHPVQQWTLQPRAEFNYSNFKLDEFTEQGGPDAQQVKVNDYDVMELGAGLKVFGEFDAGRGTIKPEASIMAYHDFKDDKPQGSYRYVKLQPFNDSLPLVGASREQNRYALGLGGTYAMDNNLSLGLNYDYNWNGDFKAHGFMARVSYEF